MKSTTITVSARDLALLKDKLTAILTASEDDDIEELATVAPAECIPVAQLLRTFAKGIPRGRQWLVASMASLPAACWVRKKAHASVHGVTGASLKYCVPGNSFWDETADEGQFLAREALCRSLVGSLDEETSERFGVMVRWGALRFPNPERHKVLLDVALADSIYQLERVFYSLYTVREYQMRTQLGMEPSVPTPPEDIRQLADAVQDELFSGLMKTAQAASGANSLAVQLLSNIAANRFLLESAQQAVHAEQAQGLVVTLLIALNDHGVDEVPEVESNEDIGKKLKEWFGPKQGVLLKDPRFNRRHDAATDAGLAYTVQLAGQVQEQYIELRGRGEGAARLQFGGPCNKLIFALAVVACAYAGIKVSEEAYGTNDRRRPAYPARNKRAEPASVHVMDLFSAIFGHIAFSNVGWALSPRNVSAYSNALAYKRACMQELVFLIFKRLSAPSLLAVHNKLMEHLN